MDPLDLDALKHLLMETHGLELSQYSDNFLERRVLARMGRYQLKAFKDYASLIQTTPEECQYLLDSLTINVTGFFRDAELSEAALHPLFDRLRTRPGALLRPLVIWSAGCATGQEPYTVAMILERYLEFSGVKLRYQIHATDVSEEQLKKAKLGEYPKAAANGVPIAYRSAFLTERGAKVRVVDSLRKNIQFYRHDVATSPPLEAADLILCRNVMIYFTMPAKNQILQWFHRCLTPGGGMILGSAEIVLLHGLFKPAGDYKIYQKI